MTDEIRRYSFMVAFDLVILDSFALAVAPAIEVRELPTRIPSHRPEASPRKPDRQQRDERDLFGHAEVRGEIPLEHVVDGGQRCAEPDSATPWALATPAEATSAVVAKRTFFMFFPS